MFKDIFAKAKAAKAANDSEESPWFRKASV